LFVRNCHIDMMMQLKIPIDIVPQGRPRFYNGVAVDPPKSRQFKYVLALIVKPLAGTPMSGEVKVKLDIYRHCKSVTSRRYGDIDNLAKAVLDALNGICWQDDSQISELHITKNLADEPRIEIEIEEIKNDYT